MLQYISIAEMLITRSALDDIGITFIKTNDQDEFLSYKGLLGAARNMLAFLQIRGIRPKDELVFQLEDNKTFIITFWACMLGGIIPVPLSVGHNDDHKEKLLNVWRILKAPWLLISADNLDKLSAYAGQTNLKDFYDKMQERMVDPTAGMCFSGECAIFAAKEDDIAFVQFSSGSTGNPKGVILTNRNLIVNMGAISAAAAYSSLDKILSWMPLTHDMGLIGFHLNPLFEGINQYLIPTDLFIRNPALWPGKATEYKASILCSPNFGYEYVIKHCPPREEDDWDLSHVRIIYNGAEPISADLCHKFLDRFSTYGLKRNAMCPVYGLAEATLAVSISRLEEEVITIALDANDIGVGSTFTIKEASEKNSISFVNVGQAVDHCSIRISIDENGPAAAGRIGHIQIKGDNVTGGYYNDEKTTKETITSDGWLKTGDLGFIKDDSLYVTGRAKDIIFINGQNYYPHDIERVAAEIPAIGLNRVAVAGFYNPESLTEEIVAFVIHKSTIDTFIPVASSLRALINNRMGIEIDRILPVKQIPKTTSGKLQRFKLVELLRNGAFEDIDLHVFGSQPTGNQAAVNSADEYQLRLISIWEKLLKRKDIGIDQKFFEIGGNSLKAAELSMLIWKEFNKEIPIATIYEKQTIQELRIEMDMPGKQEYTPIPSVGNSDYYPASAAQKGLYYFWDIHRNSTAYNIPIAVEIIGEVDRQVLENCIRQLILRHDSLRSSFHLIDDPKFKVHDVSHFSLEYLLCNKNELDEKLRNLIQPFDLAVHPLFQMTLIQVADQECVLFMDFHHIISDGVSVYQFLHELLQLFSVNRLPVLQTRFCDYTCWERESLKEERSKMQEAYWLRQLEGELPVLNLPLDFPRPPIFNTDGAKLEFDLAMETSDQLKQLARLNGVSLHALLFAVYSVFLSKYTNQENIMIGIPVAGRNHPDLQYVQGMFVNNLAIRVAIAGDEPFSGFLKRMNVTIREAIAHQDYPFEDLIRKLEARRDMDRNPVFDTMFVYQNMGLPTPENTTFTISRHFFDPGVSKFDLSLEVFERDETIQYYFEYATKLFSRPTIVSMAMHFSTLIQKIIADPGCSVSDLSMTADEEYLHFIESPNHSERNYPKEKTIHRLFEEEAIRAPDNIAIEYNGRLYTYGDLNEKADRLADLLRKRGIESGTIVGIFLRRRPELIISILGILKAGGCYLPIDADLPAHRINFVVSDSQCEFLISGDETIDRLDKHSLAAEILNIDEPGLLDTQASGSVYMNSPENLVYILYTSGTTGNPKGVMVEHRSLVNYVSWAAEVYVRGESIAFPLHTSVSFDLTVTSIFVPLITGNRMVIYEEAENVLAIEKVIADNKVDIIKLTPSHLKIIKENGAFAIRSGSRVRKLIVGGEALETQLAENIENKFNGQIEIFNEYGPTEATVGCMIHRYDKDLDLPYVPIGIPAANTAIYLLDRYLKLVPTGADGEIYISGDGIARGYLFNDELTAHKFLPDPFWPGQRMYRTGDIARQLSNGLIAFIGRTDQQIKINGHRIEPGEIQSCLIRYPGITEALVVPRENRYGQPTLYAYYKTGAAFAENSKENEIRKYLVTMLPYYMIPSKLIRVDSYPLTKNGKIDYEGLPVSGEDNEIADSIYPQNRIQHSLLAVWRTIFENEKVTIRDNFISLGGDSIKAIQLASRLSGQGISVSSKDILTYHTIEQISEHVRVAGKINTYNQGTIAGQRLPSPIEHWFFSQRFADPGYFNQSILLKLNKPIDVTLLEQTFQRLIEHHDGLRTNHNAERGVLYYNDRHLNRKFVIEVIDYRKEPYDVAEACRSLKTAFNLADDLLMKVILIKGKGQKAMLHVTFHHLLIDGVSWRVLLEDLYTIYMGLERQAKIELALKTATSGDWLEKLNEFALSERLSAERSYWEAIDHVEFALPQDFETTDWTTNNRKMIVDILDREKTDYLLKEAHNVYDTDVSILLNTALALTLQEFTGRNCLVVQQENNGRYLDTCDTSRTIGWFTAMYPVQLQLSDDSLGNQIIAIKEQLREVPWHGIGYGLYKYTGKAPVERKMAPVRFNYLGTFGTELDNDLFSFNTQVPVSDIGPVNEMTAILELNALVVTGVLRLEIYYSQKAYKETTIQRFMDSLLENIARIIDHIRHENTIRFDTSIFKAVHLDDQELNALFI
jgi:amino acid adenylation domain-containing protein/non-ribosomal peptide synthase protein (TIGR01720 family)